MSTLGADDKSQGGVIAPPDEVEFPPTRCFLTSKKSGVMRRPKIPNTLQVDNINEKEEVLVIEEYSQEDLAMWNDFQLTGRDEALDSSQKPTWRPGIHTWRKQEETDIYEHGRCFTFLLWPEDTLQTLEDRLKRRFNMPQEEAEAWRVVIFKFDSYDIDDTARPEDLAATYLPNGGLAAGMRLGLMHPGEMRPKKKRRGGLDRFFGGTGQMKIRG